MELTFEEAVHGCEKVISVNSIPAHPVTQRRSRWRPQNNLQHLQWPGPGRTVSGLFQRGANLRALQGNRSTIDKPCHPLQRRGPRDKSSKVTIRVPAEWTPARASAPPATAKPASAANRATFTGAHVRDHEIFERGGDDLLCEVPIGFVQATLGSEIGADASGKARINVPAGTQSGTILRLRGKGVKTCRATATATHVSIIVEVPTRLNSEQKAKLMSSANCATTGSTPCAVHFSRRPKVLADPIHASIFYSARGMPQHLSASEKPGSTPVRSPTTRRRPGCRAEWRRRNTLPSGGCSQRLHDSTNHPGKQHRPPALRDYAVSGRDQGQDDGSDRKATELGAHRVVPVLSERSVPDWDEAKATAKVEKWRSVCIESIKQCGSAWLPTLQMPMTPIAAIEDARGAEVSLIATLQSDAKHPRTHIVATKKMAKHQKVGHLDWPGRRLHPC